MSFEEITEGDIPEMTGVMTRAFDDDAQKHLGQERSGPEGYDNGDFFRKWLFGYQETVGYKVVSEGKVIGGIIVWILKDGHNVLGTIFVNPGLPGLWRWYPDVAVYPGKGKLLSIGDKLSFRNLAGEELALIKQRIISLVPRYRIFRDGKLRAEVNKKLLSVFRDKFKVDMKDDSPDLEIVGNIFDHKHRFLRGDNEVAHVSQAKRGMKS